MNVSLSIITWAWKAPDVAAYESLCFSRIPSTSLPSSLNCRSFFKYFKDKGFEVVGNDPDLKAAQFGISKGLDIDIISGEKMEYDKKFGLIIIIGSLEHCFNHNIVNQNPENSHSGKAD